MHMWYTPGEIAEEIDLPVQTIYRKCIPAGLPYRRDDNGRIWIDGEKFRAWVLKNKRRRSKLGKDEGYCMTCRKAVKMTILEVRPGANWYIEQTVGLCTECGGRVSRMRKKSHGESR